MVLCFADLETGSFLLFISDILTLCMQRLASCNAVELFACFPNVFNALRAGLDD